MSILMPNHKDWLVSNWISHSFFEDCLPYLKVAPDLADKIQFCVDAKVDTLDLRDRDFNKIGQLKALVLAVLQHNLQKETLVAATEHDVTSINSTYVNKLEALKSLVEELLDLEP